MGESMKQWKNGSMIVAQDVENWKIMHTSHSARGEGTLAVWDGALLCIQQWMEKEKTSPAIMDTILTMLHN